LVNVPISSGQRFLTLVGTSGPDGNYFNDQGLIGNPTLLLDGGANFGELSPFTGPGDLDLEGRFAYAINFTPEGSPDTRTVGGVEFTRDALVAGATVTSQFAADNWGTRPEYGATADDNALEEIMWDIKWSGNPNAVSIDLDVDPGTLYKLQMLFSENFWNNRGSRTADILFEGATAVSGFDIQAISGPRGGSPTAGALYTYQFIATDSVLNIGLIPGGGASDLNPIINALTLEVEVIPEPSTFLIWSIGLLGLIGWRRRRAK
jgi:hypothetical protein